MSLFEKKKLDFIILHPFFIEWDFKNITLYQNKNRRQNNE